MMNISTSNQLVPDCSAAAREGNVGVHGEEVHAQGAVGKGRLLQVGQDGGGDYDYDGKSPSMVMPLMVVMMMVTMIAVRLFV